MAYEDLRAFLKDLEKAGELKRVRAEVDPRLEISEIAQRVVRREGPALLFERPKGAGLAVLINAFGSHRRMAMALGVERYEEVARRLEALLDPQTPAGILDKIRMLPRLAELSAMFPKTVRDAPCKEVVVRDDPGLDFLPVLTCWPQDGGPYLTLPLVVTVDPATGRRNCGMYRMQIIGSTNALSCEGKRLRATDPPRGGRRRQAHVRERLGIVILEGPQGGAR